MGERERERERHRLEGKKRKAKEGVRVQAPERGWPGGARYPKAA